MKENIARGAQTTSPAAAVRCPGPAAAPRLAVGRRVIQTPLSICNVKIIIQIQWLENEN